MKGFRIVFLCLLAKFTHASETVFEFGNNEGNPFFLKEGTTNIFQRETSVFIPVPQHLTMTYVKVIVDALSPPKVDYDDVFNKVNIKFTWIQIPISCYKVIAKGIFTPSSNGTNV